jgi:hypothetical protein
MYRSTFFLTSALVGGEWSTSRLCHFTPWQRAPGAQRRGGRVGPRAGLDDMEKILDPIGTRTPTPLSSSPYPVAIPTALSRLIYIYIYIHISGVCVTNKTFLGFYDLIYWTVIQLVTAVRKSLSATPIFRLDTPRELLTSN